LQRAFRPAELLALERRGVGGHFAGHGDLRQKKATPAAQLRAVGKVEVFGERRIAPAACVINGLSPPDSGGAVEIHEPARAARLLLDDEMRVNAGGLRTGDRVVVGIQMRPAALRPAEPRVGGEHGHGAQQEVRRRHKVAVENRDELRVALRLAMRERTSLEALAIRAAHHYDIRALRAQARRDRVHDAARFIRRVVEHLDLVRAKRPLHRRCRAHDALGDGRFVIERELRHHRRAIAAFDREDFPPLGEQSPALPLRAFAHPQTAREQHVAIRHVSDEQERGNEIKAAGQWADDGSEVREHRHPSRRRGGLFHPRCGPLGAFTCRAGQRSSAPPRRAPS